MAIPESEQRKLCMRSGGRCAFAACRRVLTVGGAPPDRLVVIGEMAHIVGDKVGGPRGDHELPDRQRDRYENLILLCNTHHQLVDSQPETYTVERLRGIKEDHERWVEQRLGQGVDEQPLPEPLRVDETVFTTLLPVEHLPPYIYGAPHDGDERSLAGRLGPVRGGEMAPYIIRGRMLWAFQDMGARDNPFYDAVNGYPVERFGASEWLSDPDKARWYVDLLNRALNKLTGRRGLHLDRDHGRFYFPPETQGEERIVHYRSMNRRRVPHKVVWTPRRRKTGESKGYWLHRAVSLRFLRVADREWALSVRPELRVTDDGINPPKTELIGSRVTKKMSRTFNDKLLAEVQFWRDFLSDSQPRIVLPFGTAGQNVVISTNLMEGIVSWPGIPPEHAKAFANAYYEEDLISLIELRGFTDDNWEELDQEDAEDDDLG
jgi:hypothetical protein